MSSIILELQKQCMGSEVKVSELLRKAYVVARKLKIKDFETWLYFEMNGYDPEAKLPTYRKAFGTVKGWNPYNGWIPVIIENPETQKELSSTETIQSIGDLENLTKNDHGTVQVPLADSLSEYTGFNTKYRIEIGVSQLKAIIEKVRNIILDWLIKLEEDGILGEDMIITENEKEIAGRQNYFENNFYGAIYGTQIQQNSNGSIQNQSLTSESSNKLDEIISLVEKYIHELTINEDNKSIAKSAIETVKSEKAKDNPKKAIIMASLATLRNVLEGAAGSIIASGILYKINLFQ